VTGQVHSRLCHALVHVLLLWVFLRVSVRRISWRVCGTSDSTTTSARLIFTTAFVAHCALLPLVDCAASGRRCSLTHTAPLLVSLACRWGSTSWTLKKIIMCACVQTVSCWVNTAVVLFDGFPRTCLFFGGVLRLLSLVGVVMLVAMMRVARWFREEGREPGAWWWRTAAVVMMVVVALVGGGGGRSGARR
jgi:hypothetical protein